MKKIFSFLFLYVSLLGYAQSSDQLKTVLSKTNLESLKSLSIDFNEEYLQREARIKNYLVQNPGESRISRKDGVLSEMYDVVNGEVYYYNTSNRLSAQTARANRLYTGGTLGLNIEGQNMRVGVWDGGLVRNTHQEFPGNKVSLNDTGVFEEHGTHVTGTIVASGVVNNAKGVAFQANATSYNWTNDYSEMATEASFGLLVSNHSYWIGTNLTTWQLGAYDNRARQFDQLAFAAPYYLAVTAAGNDRNDNTNSVIGPYLTEKGGYNLIRGMQNAKNYLTVGAVNQVLNYSGPSNVTMSGFSSWGPTDDGRIKPDVVAKGTSVYSTIASSNTAYGTSQGTSMASPAVAGVALLLQQHYNNVHLEYMRAATLKGLINHTADESGEADGPDYRFGWGLVDAENAAEIISQKATGTSVMEENILVNGASYSKTITSTGTSPLMVSISWTDKEASANTGTIDPTNSNLINDLDIRVTQNETTYFPWTLNPADPTADAVRTTDNFRDNFEKIQVDNPSGTYTVTVTHKGSLVGALQAYSLIISGPAVSLDAESFAVDKSSINIFPNPASSILNFDHNNISEISKIEIIDMTGKLILSRSGNIDSSIDVSSMTAGLYLIKFITNDLVITKKFIKK